MKHLQSLFFAHSDILNELSHSQYGIEITLAAMFIVIVIILSSLLHEEDKLVPTGEKRGVIKQSLSLKYKESNNVSKTDIRAIVPNNFGPDVFLYDREDPSFMRALSLSANGYNMNTIVINGITGVKRPLRYDNSVKLAVITSRLEAIGETTVYTNGFLPSWDRVAHRSITYIQVQN